MNYEQVPQGNDVEIQESSKAQTSANVDDAKNKRIQMMKDFANSAHRSSGAPEESEIADLERKASFIYSINGHSSSDAEQLLIKHGRNELPETVIPKWYVFVSQLWEPMPIMIWMAAIIEAAIQNFVDMAILLLILFANATIAFYEITKAGDAVAALKKSLKPTATVKRDGKFINIDAALLVPGDLILLAAGSAVPADSRVNEGEIEIDEAALTGESLPVTKFQGSKCLMGSSVVRGEVEGTVESTGAATFFGKTAALLAVSTTAVLIELMHSDVLISPQLLLLLHLLLNSKPQSRVTSRSCSSRSSSTWSRYRPSCAASASSICAPSHRSRSLWSSLWC